jgi:Protein of unknown function (DUF3024)
MVTGNARVSDLAVAKVRRFCDQRVPAKARDEVCLEVTTRAATITIVERRPLWQGGPGAWTRMPIAQLRYDTAAGIWTMYWADRNRRWHRYNYLDPTPQLDNLLKEIDEDPLSMFWG